MQNLRVPLRIVFYNDGESWIAHCLEFDLIGDGATREVALGQLSDAISSQINASIEMNNPANLFKTADPELFMKFAAGKDVTVGQLHFQVAAITIEETETREYAEPGTQVKNRLAYA